jgi:dipeptidyl aminopeptidase/acylaminoacyl peptidase
MDKVVPIYQATKMYNLLKENKNRRVYLVVLNNVGHNYYGTTSLFKSIVAQIYQRSQ